MNNETVTIPALLWKETLIKVDIIKEQIERLRETPRTDQDNYWRLESDKIHLKWIKALTDLETLKAENERLRKAGNAMYDAAVQDSTGLWVMPAFEEWSKIKKEKESKCQMHS